MTKDRHRDEDTPAARERPREFGDTTHTDLAAIAHGKDSDDLDVLRVVVTHLRRGQADVDSVLAQLGPDFFSEKGGWRGLFTKLLHAPNEARTFKRRALSDYLQWLEASRGLVPASTDSASGHEFIAPGSDEDLSHLSRLARGKPTRVHFDSLKRIECRLGRCTVWISQGTPPTLSITGQPSVALPVGRTRIGRSLRSEVVLGERWTSASRNHLVVEVTASRDIVLTDLSTHGTLVSTAAL